VPSDDAVIPIGMNDNLDRARQDDVELVRLVALPKEIIFRVYSSAAAIALHQAKIGIAQRGKSFGVL
jgi:hypothetical protein